MIPNSNSHRWNPNAKKVLLTSVCRPIGPDFGDGPSVGYELLYGQVTRAQGLFSPRALHPHFSLNYIAENISAPATVLQYPSKKELIRELKKGYDFIGITFLLALFHKMKDAVALIRRYSPASKIILGGYGTVLSDEELRPYSDSICREEGVAFFRKLLEEPPLNIPYSHPLIVSRMKLFSMPTSKTGMIFAGLGCPNGCDFCCTSHFFKRKHIKLLPTGKDIYSVIERYLNVNRNMQFVVLDEDFLLNRKRALELRDAVLKGGRAISLFVFSSVRAISQYSVQEIMEMGIDGFWIGYEGTESGYAKQQGRSINEIFKEFRENGIVILASMVIGFDYQNQTIVQKELDRLIDLHPTLSQFLIYGPTPGTPFYERIKKENRLREDLTSSPSKYYRNCDGFTAMVKHPVLSSVEIERMQRHCFQEDFNRLGPSVFRALETWFLGCIQHENSPNAFLRKKAEKFAQGIKNAYPIFLAGKILSPNYKIRAWIKELEGRIHSKLGSPTLGEKCLSFLVFVSALWTDFKLRFNLFQHPSLLRQLYRFPQLGLFAHHWWKTIKQDGTLGELSVKVTRSPGLKVIWVRLEGAIDSFNAEELCTRIRNSLKQGKEKLVLDIDRLKSFEGKSIQVLCSQLSKYRSRIHLNPSPLHTVPLHERVQLSQMFEPLPFWLLDYQRPCR